MTSSICDHVSFFAVMLLCRASSRWLLSCLPKLLRSANSFCTLSTAAAFFFSSSAALPAEVNLPPPPFPLPIPRPLPRVRLLDWAAVFSVSCTLEYLTALDLHLHRHLFFFSFSFAVFDLLFFFFVLRFFLYFFVLFFLVLVWLITFCHFQCVWNFGWQVIQLEVVRKIQPRLKTPSMATQRRYIQGQEPLHKHLSRS